MLIGLVKTGGGRCSLDVLDAGLVDSSDQKQSSTRGGTCPFDATACIANSYWRCKWSKTECIFACIVLQLCCIDDDCSSTKMTSVWD